MSAAYMILIREERAQTYDFLEGLDDEQFGAIRTQILGMVPFPTPAEAKNITKAYNPEDTKTDLVAPTIEEVFEKLQCTRGGLTSKEAIRRLKIFGPNRLDRDKNKNKCLELLLGFTFTKGKRGNVGPKCKVLRDSEWKEWEASVLVPGDIIRIKVGDIVPADARLLQGNSILVNQYVLTRESLPVTRGHGDLVFSGSTCTQGDTEAIVMATGVHTFFGTPAHLVDTTNNVGHFD